MKNILKHGQWAKTCRVILMISVLLSYLHGPASCNSLFSKSFFNNDTTVAAFIQQYLNNSNAGKALYYPNTVKRFYDASNGQVAWVKEQSDSRQTWEAMLLLDCVLQYGLWHEGCSVLKNCCISPCIP